MASEVTMDISFISLLLWSFIQIMNNFGSFAVRFTMKSDDHIKTLNQLNRVLIYDIVRYFLFCINGCVDRPAVLFFKNCQILLDTGHKLNVHKTFKMFKTSSNY